MKMFLSSFRIGDDIVGFRRLFQGKRTALIASATDWHRDEERRAEKVAQEIMLFEEQECSLEDLDLRQYFGKSDSLQKDFAHFEAVWVRGGNTFTLRQAMAMSGFDQLMQERSADPEFVYGGYSAGACVLAPTLKGIGLADNPSANAYDSTTIVWDGLGLIPYSICPHYKSDHPESADVDKCVEYCIDNKLPFIALRDGESIILE